MSKILYQTDGAIATIRLNRPEKLHALDEEMLAGLADAIEAVEARQDIRVLLLGATGERAFSVGADILAWTSLEPLDMWRRWIRDGHRLFDRIAGLRQPVIAMLNGYALGGGLELALAADIRLAAETAQLGAPEVGIAAIPGWGGTQRLPALIGAGRAKQMIFSGQPISAAQAAQWGLVNEALPAEALEARAKELGGQIAANAPIAVQLAKGAIDGGGGVNLAATLEGIAGALSAQSGDAAEGLAAFREKRPPHFSGR
ncbi:MAG: enoyl-CoA hydratase-related protein [Chloroflexota bacterium]|nr:enoyl-CoA hydratase-related protein [Chloroflexota bacterium]